MVTRLTWHKLFVWALIGLAVAGALVALVTYLGYRYPSDYRYLPVRSVLPASGFAVSSVAVMSAVLLKWRHSRRGS